ncbi:D-inositol 3-phosphate glycosyltransferase [Planctomycetes bacterium CA13]|uniref:D-inositol 3-phosphate glycosyltransferase n=1 Tax=Novipirellula herctigrandis TaxID=2527986 RepID=A0A5C5Z931_9BACT|nr:D-inositol 3-phosphate glycosyltransferase [Planctomycetes bacterium CA13]
MASEQGMEVDAANKPRVAIVADNASMRMSGETALPLYYMRFFMKWGVETRMVVHSRCEQELRETLSTEELATFTFLKDTRMMKLVHGIFRLTPDRIRSLIGAQLIHWLTGLQARRVVKKMAQNNLIDVTFEPTPISPKAVSCLYSTGVPNVVGPMCGGLTFPLAFQFMDSRWSKISVTVGRFFSQWVNRFFPGKLQAKALIVGNDRTAAALPKGVNGKRYTVVESGVDLTTVRPAPFPRRDPSEPARFVYFARFVDWKGVKFLVDAFPKVLDQTNAVLDLIGDGDLFDATKEQVKRLGISGHVKFYGRLPLEEGIDIVKKSDAYMATGLRECGGLALLEAMGTGTPVIACNWMAPGEYVDDTCGIRVDVSSEQAFVDGLSEAMVRIANDDELRHRLGEGAAQRVQSNYFGWEAKARRVLGILTEVVEK